VSSKAVLAGTANCTWLVPARVAKARMNGWYGSIFCSHSACGGNQRDGRRTRCRDKARTAAVGRGSLIQPKARELEPDVN
jgi:hypothetical protein